ncbi:ABC transporter ATP-binding protein [Gordonia sp. NB41Y]|uniref:ABC transporter ATP-binding protein n=1 Tax=Gordonia sp. NB41Y TaxID=875808 RepID=UPI0006B20832|nr:ABC transporter ATP-binding protein [Gordonia sp. NB41Y]EMP12948.2 ABC transporter [Gordonia sp. NB41Y]WLP90447.1 ABC transporter ATP-binding protein [Gordonia sp. NB41Y]
MNLPLIDIVPRMQRMISHPERMRPAIAAAVGVGLVDGAALAALLPTISTLAQGTPVWGFGLAGWLWILGILSAAAFGLNYITQYTNYAVALDFLRSLHRLVGDQVARQPLGWFARPLAGALSRMVSTELMSAGEIFAHMFGPLVSRLTATVVIVVAAWFWDPLLGLGLTIAIPVFVLITLASTALMRRGREMHEPTENALANQVVEYVQCQGAIRSCGRSDDFGPLDDALAAAHTAKTRALWIETVGLLLSGMVTQGVIVVLITLTGSLAIDGSLQPIPALAFIGLALRFTSTLSEITTEAMALESRRPLLDQLDGVLTAVPLPEPEDAAALPAPGTVEFVDVGFTYSPASPPVLHDVSFTVEAGTMVALVGPSGSGKSTIARAICRFYDVAGGQVLVGGRPVTEQTTEQLMAQLSMVFQDVYLFDDTLEANVAVGRADATPGEIRAAADIAGVTEIAERLPDGWSARVGEGGRGLSGGERQRVAIARALLKDAPIVVLDEATSALDVENEANIVAAVEKLRERATVVVIAHRLATIARADTIIALDATGGIEAQGTHAELLEADGTYARFWHRLQSAQGWQLTEAGR